MSLPPTLERNLRRDKDEIDASISHFHQVVHRLQEERIGRQNERMEVLISKFTPGLTHDIYWNQCSKSIYNGINAHVTIVTTDGM